MKIQEEDFVLGEGLPYLRPYICNGEFEQAEIMLTGINPATPMDAEEISAVEYMRLLTDYDSFLEFYKKKRREAGKSAISRTRQGILAFVEYLRQETGAAVIETDVCTYPTASVKELNQVPEELQKKGRELFWKVLVESKVQVVVCYGKRAFEDMMCLFQEKGAAVRWQEQLSWDKIQKMDGKELEQLSPVGELTVNGRQIPLFVIRHLMYYGNSGASYQAVRQRIVECVNKRKK